MTESRNPFYFRVLPIDAPFCDREKELDELRRHAVNRANVVLISPRRYGKTSLVKRLQGLLAEEGGVTVYADFYGATSLEDVAARLATETYRATQKKKPLFKKVAEYLALLRPIVSIDPHSSEISISVDTAKGKSGHELLEHTLEGLGRFIDESPDLVHVVFDEFQEIAELKDSALAEGIMRSHIQHHRNASYFFVGSRRRILADMFINKKRPFYKSAIHYELPVLPEPDLIMFLVERFASTGRKCPQELAKAICDATGRSPYYSQKLAYHIFEVSGETVTDHDFRRGFLNLLEDERLLFEMMIQGLGSRQIALLQAIAREPTATIFSHEYMAQHNLGSIGTVQGAHKRLVDLDYLEKSGGRWRVVDPIFAEWLRKR